MKRIAILGSTGSAGQQALEVVRAFPQQLQVVGLAAHTNSELLAQQVEEFQPDLVSYAEDSHATLAPSLAGRKLVTMEQVAADPAADLVVSATVGALAGLPGTLAALEAGKSVVLANAEVMLMAGELLMEVAERHHASMLPVQGASSAIWQCLHGEPDALKRVILTASEQPLVFRLSAEAAQVIERGRKTHVDGVTMMGVGMRAIEAHLLFGVPFEQIEVVAHPEAVIPAMVEFVDGSVKAVFGGPTLHSSLQYALSYPERWSNPDLPSVDLVKVGRLTFHPLDQGLYPCLALALEAGRAGGTAPTVLNAANEVAIEALFTQEIELNELPRVLAAALHAHAPVAHPTLQQIMAADAWAREETRKHTAV